MISEDSEQTSLPLPDGLYEPESDVSSGIKI